MFPDESCRYLVNSGLIGFNILSCKPGRFDEEQFLACGRWQTAETKNAPKKSQLVMASFACIRWLDVGQKYLEKDPMVQALCDS